MNRYLICSIVPNDVIHLIGAPQSSNNFCFSLIEHHCFEKTLSIVPPAFYNDVFTNRTETDGVTYLATKKVNSAFISVLYTIYFNIKAALLATKSNAIWFYNINNSNFLSFLLLRFILFKKVYVILLDYTPTKRKFSLQRFLLVLMKRAYGVIALSSRIQFQHPNLQFIAGIMPEKKIVFKEIVINKRPIFLFSGILSEHTGVSLAVEVFKRLPNFDLYITGSGTFDTTICKQYPNIRYLGYLSYQEYLKLYDTIDVALSFRNPNFKENVNNFPSKILEYLSYNKIVLSTIEYPELKAFKYFSVAYGIESLIDTINYIAKMSDEEKITFSNNRLSLISHFSEKKWLQSFQLIESNA